MRAVIIATGLSADFAGLNERYPAPLLPLVDRPFVQHIVEYLVDRGMTEFDFVLSHLPEKIEHLLGDGARWGSRFRFHLARDASRPYGALKALDTADSNGFVLLAHADRLPQLPEAMNEHWPRATPLLYCLRGASDTEGGGQWSGWGWLPKEFFTNLPGDLDEDALWSHLASLIPCGGGRVEVPRVLSVQSYEELLAAHYAALTKAFPGLILSGSEAEAVIWISRNVSLHPSARLIAPVYIGENCRIGPGTQLGPNATVGNNCVLDARCTAANSVIFPGSYVGEALELEDVIVDKNLLVNVRLGAAVPVADDFIIGSLSDNQVRAGLTKLLSRLTAIVILAVTWPVLLATALCLKLVRRGPALTRHACVRLPAPANEAQWRTFQLWSFRADREPGPSRAQQEESRLSALFLRFLPALINIARGELSFVGVRPRSKEEVMRLPRDWQSLYLRSKAGIVTEAEVQYGAHPDEDELYSAEAFYATTAGGGHDLKLLLAYFGRFLKSPAIAPEGGRQWNGGSEKERLSS